MHVLWVKTDLLHPVNSGGRIRTYEMLREISRQHEVTYLALDDGRVTPDALRRASEYSARVELVPHAVTSKTDPRFFVELGLNLTSDRPYVLDRYKSQEMGDRVTRLCDTGVDVVVCDFLFPAPSMPASLPVPRVLFQHNVEAKIWERHAQVGRTPFHRAYFRLQHQRMHRAERELCEQFDWVVAVSEKDATTFREEYGLDRVSSIPTGVNTSFFAAGDPAERRPNHIVFLGSMDWMPNIDGVQWFTEEVLPRVRETLPDVTFSIVGRDPTPAVRALQGNGVTVTGTVDDVRPYLNEASLFVVPLRVGGGTRLKLYEGMSTGIGTLSTTIGAEGLPLVAGVHLRIADDAGATARAVVDLLRDREGTQAMGTRAATHVREHFGWESVARSFMDVCEQVRTAPVAVV
ncbi:MAG TPA: glycosyltransferase family 4 protein [Gemmatimonas sp.]|nr:glycosyltransferase family 4 protein [Gemmatimonas sp.]